MSLLYKVNKLLKKEKVSALLGGKVVSSFLKRHPEIISPLEDFIQKFPCFTKITQVIAWLQNDVEIKKCKVCGKRIDYEKGKRDKSLFCSMACRKSEKGNEIWKSKIKSTNPFSREDIKEKIRKTNLEKYGVDYIGQSKEAREKMKQTMMERYGVEHNSQLKQHKNLCLKSGYDKLCEKLNECGLIMMTSLEEYHGIHQQNSKINIYDLKCTKCGKEFSYKFNTSKSLNYACPHCFPFYRSRGEQEISSFISKYFEVENNNRSILSETDNPELDIFVPSKNIAIEYNGLYWHADVFKNNKSYHLNKSKECEKRNIKLIHIFEDEWTYKKRIVINRLKNILNVTSYKIYARECEIKEVNNSLSSKFLDKYHIQGNCQSSVRLGLFYKNRLVALMTFGKPRFNKSYDWELLRYVTIGSFSIVGGAGKLLNYFRNHFCGSIISYADKRWSNGNLYKTLGFTEINESEPSYYYCKGDVRYSRVKFQKHKLKDILSVFDENLSEKENMERNGYVRVWDCGNKVFVLK